MEPITKAILLALLIGGGGAGATQMIEIGPELSRTMNALLNFMTLVLLTFFGKNAIDARRNTEEILNEGTREK